MNRFGPDSGLSTSSIRGRWGAGQRTPLRHYDPWCSRVSPPMGALVKRAVPAKPRPASPAEEAAAAEVGRIASGWKIFEAVPSLGKELSEDKSSEKNSERGSICTESLLYGSDDTESLAGWTYSTEQASSCGSEVVSEVGKELSENCHDEADVLRIDSTPQLLPPVGTATLSKTGRCVACDSDASANICYKCSAQLRIGLQETLMRPLGTGRFSYCLKCQSLVEGPHDAHKEECIILGTFKGSQVAWVRKERWSCIFSGIQSDCYWDPLNGRPFLLHKPTGLRCERCEDIVASDTLYGMLARFCTIECWFRSSGAAKEYDWVNNLVGGNFDRWPEPPFDSFCITCSLPFSSVEEGAEHSHKNTHQCLKVVPDFVGGTVKVEVTRNHFMERPWTCIKDLAGDDFLCSTNYLFPLRDERAMRCRICRVRLEDGGGSQCSLDCSLSAAMVPRPLKLKELRLPLWHLLIVMHTFLW